MQPRVIAADDGPTDVPPVPPRTNVCVSDRKFSPNRSACRDPKRDTWCYCGWAWCWLSYASVDDRFRRPFLPRGESTRQACGVEQNESLALQRQIEGASRELDTSMEATD